MQEAQQLAFLEHGGRCTAFYSCKSGGDGLLTAGAYSLYTAFCYGAFDEVEAVARLGAWWFVSYPVVHLVCYLLARFRKWYVPMLVMVWLDLGFQIFAAAYEWSRENFYGVNMIVPDLAITVGFGIAFVLSVIRRRRELKRQ